MQAEFLTLEALAERVPDGALLALTADYSGCAMSAVRGLIRRGAKDLHILGVPTLSLHGELLVGAGCVATVETSAVTLGEFGLPPRFVAAVRAGGVHLKDATCPAVHAALQAAEKGLPFIPLRGLIGSDVLANRPDWKVVDNPFSAGDPIVLLPALTPDVALIHVPLVDREGNAWVGVRREMLLMAHAARSTLVTFETVYDGNLLEDERMAPGTLAGLYIDGLAEAKRGAWPLGMFGCYPIDAEHMKLYVEMAQNEAGFRAYLDRFVFGRAEAAE